MPTRVSLLLALCLAPVVVPLRAADPAPRAAAAAAASTLPSDDQCREFGEELAALISEGDMEGVLKRFDTFTFGTRTLTGLDFNETEAQGFRQGMNQSLVPGLRRQFAALKQSKFLRVQTVDGDRRVLLRCRVGDDGSVAYMAFVCRTRAAGGLVWIDLFSYTSGENFSQTARRTIIPLIAESKKGMLAKLTTKESAYATNFPKLLQATQLMHGGKAAEAWAICEKMPREVQTDRTVLMMRLQLAQQIDDTKYLRVMDDWKAAYPSDASLEFLSIDADFMRKNYDAAIRNLDAFAKRIGGDAYLDNLAANVYVGAGRFDDARKRARQAQAAEPKLAAVWGTLVTIALTAKDHADTAAVLTEMRTRLPAVDLSFVESDDEYADFRKSSVYASWLEADKKAAGAAKKKKAEKE